MLRASTTGARTKPRHLYIERSKDKVNGQPVIAGTKFPVHSVVIYVLRQGITPEELVEEFPQLSLAKIYAALSYYYDHRKEIDKLISINREGNWRKLLGKKL